MEDAAGEFRDTVFWKMACSETALALRCLGAEIVPRKTV